MTQKVLKLLFLICIFSFQSFYAQTTVSGKITDALDGQPLPGVNVIVKGTSHGVSSDFDGNYSIELDDSNVVLVFSFIGYSDKEISVNGRSVINVKMEQSAESLDEVVVTALGIKKETKALGYSLTELKGDEMSKIPETNAINALQGKVAGVNITQNATGAAGSSRVVIRGASSLTGNNQPLYVVDGIPISNENNGSAGMWGGSDGGDGISSINSQDIASISVLKGGAASALYGSRASNGVIIVTTKSGKGQEGFGVEFNTSYTFDKVDTSLQDFQTSYGQGRRGAKPSSQEEAFDIGLSSWGPKLDGTDVVQWDGEMRPYSYVGSNVDRFYRTGSTFINTLALSNSKENLTYRFSATDLSNDDVMPNSGLNRKTFSVSVTSKMAEKLTSTVNAQYIIENVNNRPRLSDAPGNANYTVAMLSPNVDVRTMEPGTNPDGSERRYSSNVYSQNPYFAAYNFRNEDTKNRIIANTTLKYDITDWL
jgi:TonB-linked SusC/RagA family outer membrane protein